MGDWGSNEREVTFTTGRTATLRGVVNVFAMEAVESGDDPELTTGRAMQQIVQYMWIRPTVFAIDEWPPDEAWATTHPDEPCVSFADLHTEEVLETIDLWKEGAEKARRFRGDAAGDGGGPGGAGVGDTSKPRARAPRGKPGGARR